MRVQVRLSPGLARAAGTPRVAVDLADGATVGDLRARLGAAHPELSAGLDSALAVVRGAQASPARRIEPGDEVALLLPIAGG
jgi:MoaE-MoaD fusion protein